MAVEVLLLMNSCKAIEIADKTNFTYSFNPQQA